MGRQSRSRSPHGSLEETLQPLQRPFHVVSSKDETYEPAQSDGIIVTDKGSTLNLDEISVSAACENPTDWVERAVEIWKKYRLLIIRDLFSTDVTDTILKSLEDLHANWSEKYDTNRRGNRLSGRYEMMDAFSSWHLSHLPGYLESLEQFHQKGGFKFLDAIGDYMFVGGHAHLCLKGTENWQPLHSDFVQPNGKETLPLWEKPEHVPFMDMIMTLHPLTHNNAALRVIPGIPPTDKTYCQFAEDGYVPPKLKWEPDFWKRAGLFPLPTGCGILRDLRIWHGGTPNTSDGDRYTSVLRFYSKWSCGMWKDMHYEGPGIDPEEMKKKLSPDTQKVISPHIIRGPWDGEPYLLKSVGWDSQYDGWAHAFSDEPNKGVKVQTADQVRYGRAFNGYGYEDEQDEASSEGQKKERKRPCRVWELNFCDLSESKQKAALALGWTESTWNQNRFHLPRDKTWGSLDEDMKQSLMELGETAETWDCWKPIHGKGGE